MVSVHLWRKTNGNQESVKGFECDYTKAVVGDMSIHATKVVLLAGDGKKDTNGNRQATYMRR